jgi:hypothetical protein
MDRIHRNFVENRGKWFKNIGKSLDKWVKRYYLCGMDDKEKEELRLRKLAQEADIEKVKKFGWYLGKVYNLPIVTKKI